MDTPKYCILYSCTVQRSTHVDSTVDTLPWETGNVVYMVTVCKTKINMVTCYGPFFAVVAVMSLQLPADNGRAGTRIDVAGNSNDVLLVRIQIHERLYRGGGGEALFVVG